MTQAPNYFSSCQKFKCSWKLGRIHVGKSTAAKHPHWAMKSYRATPQSKNMKHYKCCSLASSISRNAEKNSAWILTEEIPDVGDCRTVPKHSDSNGVESEHTIPGHVAIIMDGNHRWAKERGLPGIAGHKQGVETLRRTVVYCAKRGIKALTVFAFSTENWRRGPAEISFLLHLVEETLVEKVGELEANGVRLRFIGSMEQISTSLANSMQEAERKTEHNSDLVLTVALNYSGRADIISAGKKIAERVRRGEIKSSEINEETFAKELEGQDCFGGVGDPDLLIRTSGEKRLSNFLLWDSAYTELFFTDVYWPDFEEVDLMAAIADYSRRNRRYGGR